MNEVVTNISTIIIYYIFTIFSILFYLLYTSISTHEYEYNVYSRVAEHEVVVLPLVQHFYVLQLGQVSPPSPPVSH